MLSEKFRHILDKPLAPLIAKLPISPNAVTVLGMFITSSSVFIIPVNLFWGGLVILLGGAFDLLDGIVARMNDRKTKFGAFLDSSLDRVADGFVFMGLCWFFLKTGHNLALLLTVFGLVASLVISYIRARAEGLGAECRVGLIERPERLILIAFGCLTGLIWPVIVVLTVLSWITVLQRIFHVRGQLS
jgi:phosphatidylglycerophosphate synthase